MQAFLNYKHVPPTELEQLIPFVMDFACMSIKHAPDANGYDRLVMEIFSGDQTNKPECLLGIRFTEINTGISFACGFSKDEHVKFINNGEIAKALAGANKGLLIQATIVRNAFENATPIVYNNGIMLSGHKFDFKITVYNHMTGLEHDLIEIHKKALDIDLSKPTADNYVKQLTQSALDKPKQIPQK